MSEVKRYRVSTLPGRLTRDCPEVVEACDYDNLRAEVERLRAALHQIESDCDCDYPPSPGSIKHAAREALRATGQQPGGQS